MPLRRLSAWFDKLPKTHIMPRLFAPHQPSFPGQRPPSTLLRWVTVTTQNCRNSIANHNVEWFSVLRGFSESCYRSKVTPCRTQTVRRFTKEVLRHGKIHTPHNHARTSLRVLPTGPGNAIAGLVLLVRLNFPSASSCTTATVSPHGGRDGPRAKGICPGAATARRAT
jgi:hypothetical protein